MCVVTVLSAYWPLSAYRYNSCGEYRQLTLTITLTPNLILMFSSFPQKFVVASFAESKYTLNLKDISDTFNFLRSYSRQ